MIGTEQLVQWWISISKEEYQRSNIRDETQKKSITILIKFYCKYENTSTLI